MTSIQSDHFTKALYVLLDETFDNVQGFYLDRNTSLFQTLESITADEASIPVGGKCATLAAQVKHIAFYFDVLEKSVRELKFHKVDWSEIWCTVNKVTPVEWASIQDELRTNYDRILNLIRSTPAWPSEKEIAGAIAVVAHTAYHLGEIRQSLCIIQQ
jgi:hypothetical protein